MIRFDASKQIRFVGLERTGHSSYRCRYPVLLAAWLRDQGYWEKPNGSTEIARLAHHQAEVWVRKTGSVRVFGDGSAKVHDALKTLMN